MLRQNRGIERPEAGKPTSPDVATPHADAAPEPTTASDEAVPTNDSSTPKSDAGRARARPGATTSRSAARGAGAVGRPDLGPERVAKRSTPDDDHAPADASGVAANPALAVRPDAVRPRHRAPLRPARRHRWPRARTEGDATAASTGPLTPAQ
jgi:hypothetical protein